MIHGEGIQDDLVAISRFVKINESLPVLMTFQRRLALDFYPFAVPLNASVIILLLRSRYLVINVKRIPAASRRNR